MAIEIERKFLVNKKVLGIIESKKIIARTAIVQFVLLKMFGWHIRTRLAIHSLQEGAEVKTTITVKGTGSMVRKEYEFTIPVFLFRVLRFFYCLFSKEIMKYRLTIQEKNSRFELDIFVLDDDTADFEKFPMIAEIELESIDQKVKLPGWIGREVTGIKEYSNYYMVKHGFPDDTIIGR